MKNAIKKFLAYADSNRIKRMYEVFPTWLKAKNPRLYAESVALNALERTLHKNSKVYRALPDDAKAKERSKRLKCYEAIFIEAGGSKLKCFECESPINRIGKGVPPSMRLLLKPKNYLFCSITCVANNEDNRDRKKATCLARYGTEYVSSSQHWKQSVCDSFERRYGKGITNPSHIPEVVEKILRSRYGRKTIELGDKTFNFQGYEGVLIKHIVNDLGVPVSKVTSRCAQVGNYQYTHLGKTHKYFPDVRFRRKGIDWILEVKSTSTLASTRAVALRVLAKARAMWDLDLRFRLVLCSKTKILATADNVEELKNLIKTYKGNW